MFNLRTTIKNLFIPNFYAITIRLPADADPKYVKPTVEKLRGFDKVYLFEDHALMAFVTWRKKDLDKRIRSLYIKLPDFSCVEVQQLEENV